MGLGQEHEKRALVDPISVLSCTTGPPACTRATQGTYPSSGHPHLYQLSLSSTVGPKVCDLQAQGPLRRMTQEGVLMGAQEAGSGHLRRTFCDRVRSKQGLEGGPRLPVDPSSGSPGLVIL